MNKQSIANETELSKRVLVAPYFFHSPTEELHRDGICGLISDLSSQMCRES